MDPDDRLLQRALKKKLPLFIIPCGDEYEFNKLRDKAIDLKWHVSVDPAIDLRKETIST